MLTRWLRVALELFVAKTLKRSEELIGVTPIANCENQNSDLYSHELKIIFYGNL
jgi:hypothetical protein